MSEVGKNISLGLQKRGFEIVYLGWFSRLGENNSMPFKVYHTSNQYYGQDVFDKVVWQEKPVLVLTIGDSWMCDYIANPNIFKKKKTFFFL